MGKHIIRTHVNAEQGVVVDFLQKANAMSAQHAPELEAVRVSVRIRPLIAQEADAAGKVLVVSTSEADAHVFTTNPKAKGGKDSGNNTFQFDGVLSSVEKGSGHPVAGLPTARSSVAQQHDVYEALGRPLLNHGFKGFNACLLAYGQTGSGKTYTMMGKVPPSARVEDVEAEPAAGIIPRLCAELFRLKGSMEVEEAVSRWTVEVGYVEVYNEQVADLVGRRGGSSGEEVQLEVREHPTMGPFIDGQRFKEVRGVSEVMKVIERGNAYRRSGSTAMNERSSRSHAIFMLQLTEERTMRTDHGKDIKTGGKRSRINLVDLAGSERVTRSEVVGQQFTETAYINKSLTTLGRVIDMLADKAKKGAPMIVPPYRESKLTFILKDCLGGNSKTFMVATVSPSAIHYEETVSTLRYASRARQVINAVKVNEDPRARRIRQLEEEIAHMRSAIAETDPGYVTTLEEKLALLESEAQKRAADLQALEKEREQTALNAQLLRATEEDKAELERRKVALEVEVRAARQQATEQEEQNRHIREEHARRERELVDKLREHEAKMASVTRRKDAEIASGEEHLEEAMRMLADERRQREEAMRGLSNKRKELDQLLRSSRQTVQEQKALREENEALARRMQRLQDDLDRYDEMEQRLAEVQMEADERAAVAAAALLEVEELEVRYENTVDFVCALQDRLTDYVTATVDRCTAEKETALIEQAADRDEEQAWARREHDAQVRELQWEIDELREAKEHDAQRNGDDVAAIRAERDELLQQVAALRAERDDWRDRFHDREAELDGTVQQLTTERDDLAHTLDSTTKAMAKQLKEMAASKGTVQQDAVAARAAKEKLSDESAKMREELNAIRSKLTGYRKTVEEREFDVRRLTGMLKAYRNRVDQH